MNKEKLGESFYKGIITDETLAKANAILVIKCANLEQQAKKQKEVIDKVTEKINDYKIYCEKNKGFTEYTDIEIEAIEPVISKLEDILKEGKNE